MRCRACRDAPFTRTEVNVKTSLVRHLLATAFSVSVLATAGSSAAQTIPSAYRFIETGNAASVFAGHVWADPGVLDLGPTAAVYFGARYGIRVTGPIVLEAEIGYMPATRAVRDTVPADTALRTVGEADQRVLLATAALRFNITGPRTYHGVQPFLRAAGGVAIGLGGGGAADEQVPADLRFDFGTTFATQIGAGIEWFAGRTFTFRVDGGVMLWEYDTPLPFLFGEEGLNRPGSEWTQHYSLSAGLVLRF